MASGGTLTIKALLDASGLKKGVNDVKSSANIMSSAFNAAQVAIGNLGSTAVMAVFNKLKEAVQSLTTEAVKVGMEFDKSMSQVGATLGYSVSELNDASSEASQNMAKLRDFALEMGSTTAFTSTQAAEALNYMALAGYDAETSMEMLPTVLNLAAAGNMELAKASDMVTDAQSALGLSTEETTAMVDQMAKTASSSNTSVEQLGEAFLTVGGTAKMLKGGTAELSQVLGILADNGIKGSEGGTQLRNVLLALASPTKEAEEMMDKLDLSLYDANGDMKSMQDVIGELGSKLDGLTTEERTNIIATIFNKRDLKAVEALLGTTTERWDELGDKIDDAAGAAEKMAATQLDNLAGDVTIMQSAFEGLQIRISTLVTPALRTFVQIATDVFTRVNEFIDQNQDKFEALGNVLTLVGNILGAVLKPALDLVGAAFNIIGAIVGPIIDAIGQMAAIINETFFSVEETAGGFSETFSTFFTETIPQAINDFITFFLQFPVKVLELLTTAINNVTQFVKDLIGKAKEGGSGFLEGVVGFVMQLPSKILGFFGNIIANAAQFVSDFAGQAREAGSQFLSNIKSGIQNVVNSALSWGRDIVSNIANGIKNAIGKVKEAVGNVASVIRDFLHFSEPDVGPLSDFSTYMPDMIDLMVKGIDGGRSKLMAAAEGAAAAVSQGFSPSMSMSVAGAGAGAGSMTSYNINMTVNAADTQSFDAFIGMIDRAAKQYAR